MRETYVVKVAELYADPQGKARMRLVGEGSVHTLQALGMWLQRTMVRSRVEHRTLIIGCRKMSVHDWQCRIVYHCGQNIWANGAYL